MTAYIAYLRQSTQKQAESGLGIEAQQAAINGFLKPGDTVLATLIETESGRSDSRPQLATALRQCRQRKATLLIARLDRLSRRVSFLSRLMDSDVPFVACDNPSATRFTLHILAAVAEHEQAMISQRTKAALQAAKARGVVLGGWRGNVMTEDVRKLGRAANEARARDTALGMADVVHDLRAQGHNTLRALADALNSQGYNAPRGGTWHAATVHNLLSRIDA